MGQHHLHHTNPANNRSAVPSRDYDSHTPPASPAVVRPLRAPLPRLNEGVARRSACVLPFGPISNLRAFEVPRTSPFYPRP